MHLTKTQERKFSGENGPALRKAMEILVGLGDAYDADSLIPVYSSHLSGVSFTMVGKVGLNFVKDLANQGAKVCSLTTLNPVCMDLENWRDLGVPEDFVKKQFQMIEVYKKLGVEPTFSCVPHNLDNRPPFGRHIAWSESSAVVFANSVLGARSNREGAPSALASSLTGLTPRYGYHLDENRKGNVTITPEPGLLKGAETWPYGVFGYWVGENFPDSVPVIDGVRPDAPQLKALGAAMATSGMIALFHIPDLTPEAKANPELCETDELATFEQDEYEDTVANLDKTPDVDLICLGCPHYSLEELNGLPSSADKEVWACLPRKIKEVADEIRITGGLENRGIRLVCDTCSVVAPLSEMGYSSIGVNSAKAAHYLNSLTDLNVHFAPVKELLK